MKKIILFLFIGGVIISCKKEEITPEEENEPAAVAAFTPEHVFAVLEYESPNYLSDSYSLDIDNDGQGDFTFEAYCDNMGNGQIMKELKVGACNGNGAQIVVEPISDSIISYLDSTYYDVSYNRVKKFNLNDTITNSLNYEGFAYVTRYHTYSFWLFGTLNDSYHVNKTFYIAGKLDDKLVWIKVHIMGLSDMEILDFGYVENQNELIIDE